MKPDLFIAYDCPAQRSDWLETCVASQQATFFHTPYWAETFSRCEIVTRHIRFNDGVSVILPLVYECAGKGLIKVYQSMPACTFGGWISKDTLTENHCRILLNHLKKFRNLSFRENPYDNILQQMTIDSSVNDFTYTIPIANGYHEFLKNSNYAHRKALKKGIDSGMKVIVAEDIKDWESYFQLYIKSVSRWKDRKIYSGTFYNEDFLKRIHKINISLRKLWLAIYDSKPIAGILCFYWNKHAVAWHGAADERFFNFRPNNLLYNTAIDDACQKGYNWFDCNPSGGISGVIQFKKNLGAKEIISRVVEKKSLIRKTFDTINTIVTQVPNFKRG